MKDGQTYSSAVSGVKQKGNPYSTAAVTGDKQTHDEEEQANEQHTMFLTHTNEAAAILLTSDELTLQPIQLTANAFLPGSLVNMANTTVNSSIGILGGAYAAQRAYLNYIYIIDAKEYLLEELEDVTTEEVDKYLKLHPEEKAEHAIEKIVRQQMVNKLTQNTIAPGIAGTSLMSAVLVSFSLIFPPVAPLLLGLSVALLGVGALATGLATVVNRKKISKKVKTLFNKDEHVKAKALSKSRYIQQKKTFDQEFKHARKKRHFFHKVAARSLDFIAAVKIAATFNMLSNTLKIVTTTFQHIALMLLTIGESAKNYYSRKEQFLKFSKILAAVFIPKMHLKKYLFFGKTKFEEFVLKHKKAITAKLELSEKTPLKIILDKLKFDTPVIFKGLQELCIQDHISEEFKKFCKKNKIDSTNENAFDDFVKKEICGSVRNEVRAFGITGSFTSVLCFGSLAVIFPPLFIVGIALAAASAIAGPAITEKIARSEARKFGDKSNSLLKGETYKTSVSDEGKSEDRDAIALIRSIKSSTDATQEHKIKDFLDSSNTHKLTKKQALNILAGVESEAKATPFTQEVTEPPQKYKKILKEKYRRKMKQHPNASSQQSPSNSSSERLHKRRIAEKMSRPSK